MILFVHTVQRKVSGKETNYIRRYLSSQWSIAVKHRQLYVLMLPFVLIFSVFTIFPVLLSAVLSLTSYNILEFPKFVGWDNYVRMFIYDDVFPTALKNTFAFALITGPVSYLLCFFFAWIINDLPHRIRSVLTLVFYAPSISGNLFAIWLLFFSGDMYGYLNSYLMRFGFVNEPVQWLNDPRYMFTIVVIVQLWVSLGTSFLSMRAGFTTIDKQYYEAAAVDGIRDRWQELWYITLPMMAPHLMLSAVLSITSAFSVSNVAVALTGMPSTNYATHTLLTHMLDYGTIRYERGYASAIATLLFVVSIGLNKLIQSRLKKLGT